MNAVSLNTTVAQEIETLLCNLQQLYQNLSARLAEHELAIRKANPKAIEAAVQSQRPLWEEAARLDQRRREITAKMATLHPKLVKAKGTQVTLTDLATLLPESGRLTALTGVVRGLIESVYERVRVIRRASESLLAHMEGMMRQVSGTMNHARTYGRGGRVEAGPSVISALDLRT